MGWVLLLDLCRDFHQWTITQLCTMLHNPWKGTVTAVHHVTFSSAWNINSHTTVHHVTVSSEWESHTTMHHVTFYSEWNSHTTVHMLQFPLQGTVTQLCTCYSFLCDREQSHNYAPYYIFLCRLLWSWAYCSTCTSCLPAPQSTVCPTSLTPGPGMAYCGLRSCAMPQKTIPSLTRMRR